MTELELVARARAGDQSAFVLLVEAHQKAVYNLCYRMLGVATEAEDAAQETFLRAYRQLGRYDPGRPFKTWLLSIGSHHCIDRLRRRKNWQSLDEGPDAEQVSLRDPNPAPEELAIRQERNAYLQALLGKLSSEDRSVVVMRYWHDLSYEEIAQATGYSVSAVKSRLHRARGALAARMV